MTAATASFTMRLSRHMLMAWLFGKYLENIWMVVVGVGEEYILVVPKKKNWMIVVAVRKEYTLAVSEERNIW